MIEGIYTLQCDLSPGKGLKSTLYILAVGFASGGHVTPAPPVGGSREEDRKIHKLKVIMKSVTPGV